MEMGRARRSPACTTTERRSARRLLVLFLVLGQVCFLSRRLALGADGGDHLPHLANTNAIGDLEFDLVVIDDLGHLADQAALGHDSGGGTGHPFPGTVINSMQPIKLAVVAGARPNFMKIAPLMKALAGDVDFETVLIHTGQHYDDN